MSHRQLLKVLLVGLLVKHVLLRLVDVEVRWRRAARGALHATRVRRRGVARGVATCTAHTHTTIQSVRIALFGSRQLKVVETNGWADGNQK